MVQKDNVSFITIKTANREKILRLFLERRELTKQEISRETGISIPTVASNISYLLKEGVAEDAGVSASTGGRRPAVLRLVPDSKYSFGVDLSPETVRIILTNLDLEIREDVSFATGNFNTMDDIMDKTRQCMEDILRDRKISRDKILGVGISLYGTVNEEKMILETAPNLNVESRNIDFCRYESMFGFPIIIENDANASALAEMAFEADNRLKDLVFVSIGTGIGCGILIKGQLFKGENKRAGEFGHMTVASNGRQCMCGGKDCWELYASERSLLKEYNGRTGKRTTDIAKIISLVQGNDADAVYIWNQYLDYLSTGIRNIILIHDPRCIIIGGRISRYENLLMDALKDRVFQGTSFYGRDDVLIRASTLKENASVIGASLLAFQKLFFLRENVI